MKERRSKTIIFVDILKIIFSEGGKAKPTRILYGANLSHPRLKKYLSELIADGLIEKVGGDKNIFYKITSKGQNFLREFKKVKEFSEAFGIPL